MRTPRVVLSAAVALVLAVAAVGCATKAKPVTAPETQTPATTEIPAPTPPPTPPPQVEPFPRQDVDKTPVVAPTIDELNREGVLKTVSFAYNSNQLDDQARTILQGNAEWLKAHPSYNVEIAGHCDERGSIGYNVALGDRRASAVKDYLVTLGAAGDKLGTVTFGKEKPLDPGHNEAAWAKNRRAEFTIKP